MKTQTLSRLGLGLLLAMAFTGCKKEPVYQTQGIANTTQDDGLPETASPTSEGAGDNPATVYVCHSAGAKKYHYDENCHGLKRCTHEIVSMPQEQAEGKGLGLCGFED